jgi:MFS family permease
MISADLVRAVVVVCMLLVASRSTIWLVYPLLVMETIMAAFFEPARNSVIPNITRREDVIVANTLSAITWSFDLAVGATLGGVAFVFLGKNAVFILNALSFVGSALLIGSMKFEEPHVAGLPPLHAREAVDFSPMLEGVRYLRRLPRLLATVLVKGGLGLMIGATWVIYAVMGERLFAIHFTTLGAQRGATLGMSLLIGARGIGALLGPLVAANWAGQRDSRLRLGILLGFLLTAVGIGALSLAPNVWVAIACVVVSHFGGSIIWTFSTTMLQLNSDDQFRGRVFAADLGICMAAISVTAYAAAAGVDAGVPIRLLAACAGGFMLLPALLWAWAQRLWKSV